MRKILWTLLLLSASSAIKGLQANQGGHMEMTRLRMSLMYLRVIKTFRLLFMSLLGMGLCLVFLFMGLLLFHAALFLYSPWSMETKMLLGFIGSVFYILVTGILFYKIFDQDQWLKIFNAQGITKHLREDLGTAQEASEEIDSLKRL